MKVLFVIPAYNEEANIENVIKEMYNSLEKPTKEENIKIKWKKIKIIVDH